ITQNTTNSLNTTNESKYMQTQDNKSALNNNTNIIDHSNANINSGESRSSRELELEQLKLNKPSRTLDSEEDIAAIEYASRNMGDYKLKSSPNYIVPEALRVNAETKRRQMILLQESVHY